ncbi:hypothetical protein VE01_08465 [Pseudogymnoascus verrucosus]|uniref:Uncharacterized protein n=1 Tax=Pseudogymnoascus verrucosus TaxID=342668 RepID=A0A1B8GBT8_9PEZI|nr:uncharacterized protein VE01_08465 [Pseudogymnoascus verrucosus]OBT93296.1 hypothetical protein VE01_08465 [Pseudogymnoascus verrucosus]
MHPPVEAQSLSSLLQIASNPPRYPRNPSEPKRDPLVLYIARVPGSQDVILTPLKPDLKNLKELDVASCLYYLHRNVPSDAALVVDLSTHPVHPPTPHIARKPLPKSSAPITTDLAAPPPPDAAIPTVSPLDPPHPSSPPPKPPRRPLNDPISALPLKPPPLAPPRRPLGPRPRSLATPAAVPATEGQENAPLLPPRPYPEATTPTAAATSQARGRADALFPTNPTSPNNHSPTHLKATEPYTITLIRRDPPTGAQWTIGSLLISPRSTPSVVVTLTTPGYTTFSSPPGDFKREINTDKPVTAVRRRGHRRGHSAFSTHSSDQAPIPQPKDAQAYTFPSPWSTPCTFATAPSGRALRCTHELPAVDAEGEPTVEGVVVSELRYNTPTTSLFGLARPKHRHGDRHGERGSRIPGTLPGALPLPRPQSRARPKSAPSSPLHAPSNYLAHESSWTGDEDGGDRDSGADLSLGREKAGGGRAGGRAKLGKLIVFGDGIKMLDLLVAGNMGVWYEGWGDKGSGEGEGN